LSTYEKVKQPDKKADSSGCSSFTVSELLAPQQIHLEQGHFTHNFCDLPINDPTTVTSERHALIGQLDHSGGGEALDSKTRANMETDLGYNFGSVRVHTDNYAANLTNALNAKATCYGQDIYFGKNHYSPNTQKGTNLLKHELTHYQQQNQTGTKIVQNQEETKASQKLSSMVDDQISRSLMRIIVREQINAIIEELINSETDGSGIVYSFYTLDRLDQETGRLDSLGRSYVQLLVDELDEVPFIEGPSGIGNKEGSVTTVLGKLKKEVHNPKRSKLNNDVFRELFQRSINTKNIRGLLKGRPSNSQSNLRSQSAMEETKHKSEKPPFKGKITFLYRKPAFTAIATPLAVSRIEGGNIHVLLKNVSHFSLYVERGLTKENSGIDYGAFMDGIVIPETMMVRVIMLEDGKEIEVPALALIRLKDEFDVASWMKMAEAIGYGLTIASLGAKLIAGGIIELGVSEGGRYLISKKDLVFAICSAAEAVTTLLLEHKETLGKTEPYVDIVNKLTHIAALAESAIGVIDLKEAGKIDVKKVKNLSDIVSKLKSNPDLKDTGKAAEAIALALATIRDIVDDYGTSVLVRLSATSEPITRQTHEK